MTFNLLGRGPAKISIEAWPVVAEMTTVFGENEITMHAYIREHSDGRKIVYGSRLGPPGDKVGAAVLVDVGTGLLDAAGAVFWAFDSDGLLSKRFSFDAAHEAQLLLDQLPTEILDADLT